MATEYCDVYTYKQIYGHEPPTDGSYDPALNASPIVMGVNPADVETKVVEPEPEPEQKPARTRARTKQVG